MALLNSARCNFRKGWKNERELFCSGEAFALADGDFEFDDDGAGNVALVPTYEAEGPAPALLAELAHELELPE